MLGALAGDVIGSIYEGYGPQPKEFELFAPLADRADELAERAGEGIDTDGDGVSDSVETEISELTAEAATRTRTSPAATFRPSGVAGSIVSA